MRMFHLCFVLEFSQCVKKNRSANPGFFQLLFNNFTYLFKIALPDSDNINTGFKIIHPNNLSQTPGQLHSFYNLSGNIANAY